MRHWLAIIPLIAACTPEVTVRGTLLGTRADKSLAWPNATVRAFDQDGVLYDTTTSSRAGRFAVSVPRGQTVFIEVGDEWHPTASFTGVSGFTSPLVVNRAEDPDLYGVKTVEYEELRAMLEGCPGLDDGAVVVGQVFANDLIDMTTDDHPIIITASASVLPLDGEPIEGCYLDPSGSTYDPEADRTGNSGMFAVVGLPPGLHTLVVENHIPGGLTTQTATSILVDEAVVLPRFPFLMESGLLF